jgi:hypothetical protein
MLTADLIIQRINGVDCGLLMPFQLVHRQILGYLSPFLDHLPLLGHVKSEEYAIPVVLSSDVVLFEELPRIIHFLRETTVSCVDEDLKALLKQLQCLLMLHTVQVDVKSFPTEPLSQPSSNFEGSVLLLLEARDLIPPSTNCY